MKSIVTVTTTILLTMVGVVYCMDSIYERGGYDTETNHNRDNNNDSLVVTKTKTTTTTNHVRTTTTNKKRVLQTKTKAVATCRTKCFASRNDYFVKQLDRTSNSFPIKQSTVVDMKGPLKKISDTTSAIIANFKLVEQSNPTDRRLTFIDETIPLLTVISETVRLYIQTIVNTTNNNDADTKKKVAVTPPQNITLRCDLDSMEDMTRTDMVQALQTSTSFLKKEIVALPGSIGIPSPRQDDGIIGIIFNVIALFVDYITATISVLFQIVFAIPEFIFLSISGIISFILEILFGRTQLDAIMGITSSSNTIIQQLDTCYADLVTGPAFLESILAKSSSSSTIIGSTQRKPIQSVWNNIIKSETVSYFMDQILTYQDSVEYQTFVCKYKEALCG